MLLGDVVATLDAVAATRSRTAKTDLLAGVLTRAAGREGTERADAERAGETRRELMALVGLLTGRLRQGRVGVGWRTIAPYLSDCPGSLEEVLTVAEVDRAMQALLDVPAGAGSGAVRAGVLTSLFGQATEAEQAFLGRVLTGEVRTGALEGVATDAVARAAGLPLAQVRRAAMLSGDLAATAALALTAPHEVAGIGLRVGTPVLPMLAATAADVTEALQHTGPASIEYKLDGARIQVHRDGESVLVVTRNLGDVTSRVPGIVHLVRGLDCRTVVLDGETLLSDEAGAPRPFQETMARFGSHAELLAPNEPAIPGARARPATGLQPWFFDLLHLDGRDLLDEPLTVRRELLAALVGPRLIPGIITDDPGAAARFLDESLATGHEGVMIKATDSAYEAGRRGKSWLKVKPVRTLDLVVLACEWGSGRRQGWLSNLHLGARDPDGSFGAPGGFVMVGKTFKGMTDEMLRWQTETFQAMETSRSRYAVHVRPEIVVEIAVDGVQRSSRYAGGVALRFARVKGYRPDKSAAEADTIATVRALGAPTP